MRPRLRTLSTALSLTLVAALVVAGCGEPQAPGGSGRLEAGGADGVDVLRVEGTPYEMGWWQGYLLRDQILALHGTWEAALFEALLGPRRSGAGAQGAREALERHCDLCLDQTLHRMSERMLQELDGLASGCGVAKEKLLRVDVLRDALRMKGLEARLPGAAGLIRQAGGYEARIWWSGPDTDLLERAWLLVVRAPVGEPPTVVLAWPGSLGGVAGLRADGLGYLSGEGQVREARRRGFGGGRPFTIAARQALEETGNGFDLIAEVTGTMGHAMLGFSMHAKDGRTGVLAMAAFQVYGYPDPPWVPGRGACLAAGPYEQVDGPQAVALQEAFGAPDLEPEERWLRLRGHADPTGEGQGGPGARIEWAGGGGQFAVALPDGRKASVWLGEE